MRHWPDVRWQPAYCLATATVFVLTFTSHKRCHAVSELGTDLFYRNVSVLYGVVQGCGGQEFLIGCHRSHDFHCLHRMDDIGETLAAALSPGMGADGEHDGAVQQCGV